MGRIYNSDDRELMTGLGLRIEGFERDWTDIGTVELGEGGPIVQVSVAAAPALFWRFTINRQASGQMDREILQVSTGSGSFSEYWPAVQQVAHHCFEVEWISRPVVEVDLPDGGVLGQSKAPDRDLDIGDRVDELERRMLRAEQTMAIHQHMTGSGHIVDPPFVSDMHRGLRQDLARMRRDMRRALLKGQGS